MVRQDKWDDEVIHGALEDGTYVTLKHTESGNEVLMARGHLDDIGRHTDHVHAWGQKGGTPDHHDTRWSGSLSPDGKPEKKSPKEAHDSGYAYRRQQLIDSARACGSDIKAVKNLQSEWDSLGKASTVEWNAFRRAVDSVYAADKAQREQRRQAHEARMAEWAQNRTAKESLVREAESLASSSDLKSAGERMKTLGDHWKAVGPCDRTDNERLWSQFNAARTKLHDRKQREFEERKRQWAQNKAAKESLVREAESLASSSDLKSAGERMKTLGDRWKALGPCDRTDNERLWSQFNAARTKLHDRKQREFEERKRQWAQNKAAKESLVREAESLASSSDLKSAGERMKTLGDRWKALGPCDRTDNERLWSQFNAARTKLHDRKQREFEERKRQWAQNKAAKESLVREAESLASSSDLKSAGERMKTLGDRWKALGPCDRTDNERLWSQFNAARTKLHDRKQREFEERKRQWAQNKAAKEALVSRMRSLLHTSDFRSAKEGARGLQDEWKRVGPCEKTDNDRLWNDFNAAKTQLFEAARQDGERRKAEALQRAQQRVWQLEEQLRNAEAAIIRADESYSRALNARSPSYNNPNAYSIISNQQMRQSQARDRVVQAHQRRDQVVNRLLEARSRLNQF